MVMTFEYINSGFFKKCKIYLKKYIILIVLEYLKFYFIFRIFFKETFIKPALRNHNAKIK